MLSDRELPPLPTESYIGEEGLWEMRVVLTEESVRDYARAVERAAYERAAQECFERPYLEVLHDDYWTACKDCADAIRALGRK